MKNPKDLFLPKVNINESKEVRPTQEQVIGNAPCPCCGYITIPNHGDALAYICPVCLWEIDLFIKSEHEPSDQNHGLSLLEAKSNYMKFGAVLSYIKKHCREPKECEYPIK